ncbi:MAG TPA: hypothetical protein PL051_03890 [Candidatus Saccharibacteria bacterium]|nr:hypothetical protein [Candidatus Saccharibacteria bacterium]
MSKSTKEEQEQMGKEWYELTHKNWRAWGSWFSWGSPVGLGLFFIETAAAIWILAQVF